MKRALNFIKYPGLIGLVVLLYAFTTQRNQSRSIDDVEIEFIEEQSPYINDLAVNKLLIQNQVGVTNVGKEILVLNTLEKELDRHRMIQDSDVYLTVNGQLKARIKQRTPIARVNAIESFYIDMTGQKMPLSNTHAAHVPIVDNVSDVEIAEVYPLLKKIREDEFLQKHIVSVYQDNAGDYLLDLRVLNFKINLGKVEDLDQKIKNFKAFYQKAMKDQTLEKYQQVSLQFKNQVVCTLK